MNKYVVGNSQGSEELFETISLGIAPGEIILGSLVGIDTNGNPQVSFPQIAQHYPLAAVTTVAVTHQHVGRQVALLFANGDIQKPIIMGFIHNPLFDLLENFSLLQTVSQEPSEQLDQDPFEGNQLITPEPSAAIETVRVDGKRVVIEGQEEIVLTCGDASITLTKAGKILIRGKYLVSRSSGVNRILGGSVQVN